MGRVECERHRFCTGPGSLGRISKGFWDTVTGRAVEETQDDKDTGVDSATVDLWVTGGR
jgi:hypothetical protein